jgi:hypothetical protein
MRDGVLNGWTFIPARDMNYAQNLRRGVLWWGAK